MTWLTLLHGFDRVHQALFLPAVLVAVLLWFTAALIFLTGNRDWRPFRHLPSALRLAMGGFVAIILFFMMTGFGIEWLALASVRPILMSNVTAVTVDGHSIAHPQILVDDLRKLPNGSYHHTHPTTIFHVVLQTENGPLALDLSRDSGIPSEYWVSDPAFRSGMLGKIRTNALDGL